MKTAKHHILCVDSEDLNLQALELMLSSDHCRIFKANSKNEALDLLRTEEIDMVILETSIDSFELCRTIRSDNYLKNIAVILNMNPGMIEKRVIGMRAGADDFITRPFDNIDVNIKVRRLLMLRELKQKLRQAYLDLTTLAEFGEEIMNSFDPFRFDLMAYVESLVSKIIRKKDSQKEKPGLVMVGVMGKKEVSQWYYFEHSGHKLKKTLLAFDLGWKLPLRNRDGPESCFYNEDIISTSHLKPLLDELKSLDIDISNIVSFNNDDLHIVALNYGRKVTDYDSLVLKNMVMQNQFLNSVSSRIKNSDDMFLSVIDTLSELTEKNVNTESHMVNVGTYSAIMAEQLGFSEEFISAISTQAKMHDLGNCKIPISILQKPGRLTEDEFSQVKNHTIYGAEILGRHNSFLMARNISIAHHEKWDGSGYPFGLRGENIPVEARIVHLADQYDTLRRPTVYRQFFDHQTAYRIITKGDGRTLPCHFDPEVLLVFKQLSSRFNDIHESTAGQKGSQITGEE